jgi:hypothetical protein
VPSASKLQCRKSIRYIPTIVCTAKIAIAAEMRRDLKAIAKNKTNVL